MKKFLCLISVLAVTLSAFAEVPDVAGKWKWIYDRNGEAVDIEMNLKQQGSKFAGRIVAPEGREIDVRDGKVSDEGKVTFYIEFPRDGDPLRIDFAGKAEGDKITGATSYTNSDGEKREREWNAKRESSRNLTGKWVSIFKRSDGSPMETTLNLKQAGDKLSGTQTFNENETELRDGKIQGDEVTFRTTRERDGRTVTSKYRGKIQKDNSIKGEIESDWTGEMRRLEWEAKKSN